MTEREQAERVAKMHGKYVLQQNNTTQMGGMEFGEAYGEILAKGGGMSVLEIGKIEMACRHWVEVVWIDENTKGLANCIISNAIMNC